MMKSSFFLALLFCSGHALSQSPGGVDKIIAWVNAGPKINNAQLSRSVTGITGNKIHSPNSLLNYNPVFQFDGPEHPISVPVQLGELTQATIFIVYQAAGPGPEQNIWKISDPDGSFHLTTKKI